MKKYSITAVSIAALMAFPPAPAAADVKDAIVGGIIGGIVGGAIQNQRNSRPQTTVRRKAVQQRTVRQAAPTLNSKYSRSERIQIQSALANQGYPIGTVDGVLGKNSRAAIRQYQGSLGQAQTGQLTVAQFASLTGTGGNQLIQPQLANRPLATNEVALMQQSLQRLGFYRGRIDGIDGPGTRNATTTYFASQGLNPNGLTNVQTLVTVASAAGMVAPPYLMQEANAPSGFGAGQTQQAFGQQPQQQLFGNPQTQQAVGQQPQQQLFGNPQTQQAVGQQPQQQLFGNPQTQQAVGQQPQQQQQQQQTFDTAPLTQDAFGQQPANPLNGQQPAPQGQQPLFPQQPGQVAPQQQGSQGTALFASGNPALQTQPQVQPQAQPQAQQVGVQQNQQPLFPQQAGGQQVAQPVQQQPQSTLDVYAPATDVSVAVQPQGAFGNANN